MERILIIEDDELIAELERDYLEANGYETDLAFDGITGEQKAKSVIKTDPALPLTIFRELQKDGNMCTDLTAEDITYLMPEILRISFSDDMIQMLPGESVVGEDGHTEYRMDVDLVKQIVIDTFYKEVQ